MVSTTMYVDIVAMYIRDPDRSSRASSLQAFLEECPDKLMRQKLATEAGLTGYAERLLYTDYVAETMEMSRPQGFRRRPSSRT